MSTLVYIGLLGVFSYYCQSFARSFKGSSLMVKTLLTICGGLGYLSFFAFIVWSFFKFTWWEPLLTLIVASVLGGITIFLVDNMAGKILSLLAVPILIVFCVLCLL